MTPAQRAAAEIFLYVHPGRMDETGNLTLGIERIIYECYAERDAAVAELVDCVESALRCSELRCSTCKIELNGALMNLAALEGK